MDATTPHLAVLRFNVRVSQLVNFDQVCIELTPLGKLSVLPAKAAPVGLLELVFGHLVGLQLRLAAASFSAL